MKIINKVNFESWYNEVVKEDRKKNIDTVIEELISNAIATECNTYEIFNVASKSGKAENYSFELTYEVKDDEIINLVVQF